MGAAHAVARLAQSIARSLQGFALVSTLRGSVLTECSMSTETPDFLCDAEKRVRDRFVEEYLQDYDPVAAAIRIGYGLSFAQHYAQVFMQETYTLQLIQAKEAEACISKDEDKHRAKIVAGLYREAGNMGSSGSARVAALAQLARIIGIEAPAKTEQSLTLKAEGPDLSHLSVSEMEDIKRKLYASAT